MTDKTLESLRKAFIESVETDHPAYDHGGAARESFGIEAAIICLSDHAQELMRRVRVDGYALNEDVEFSPAQAKEDALNAFIDSLEFNLRPEAIAFMRAVAMGVK